MNCNEQEKIYEDFKKLREEFDEKVEIFRQSGQIDEDYKSSISLLSEKQKYMLPLLEKYFAKYVVETLLKTANPIWGLHELPNGKILLGGTPIIEYDPETQKSEEVAKLVTPSAFHTLDNGDILVGGCDANRISVLSKNKDQNWESSNPEWIKFPTVVNSFHQISPDKVLVVGGILAILDIAREEYTEIGPREYNIGQILPNRKILLGGTLTGEIKTLDIDTNDYYTHINFGEAIYVFHRLPDNRVLIGGRFGKIRVFDPQHPQDFDLKIELDDRQEQWNFDGEITVIKNLPNGEILIGGGKDNVKLFNLEKGFYEEILLPSSVPNEDLTSCLNTSQGYTLLGSRRGSLLKLEKKLDLDNLD